ncbi:MAG TPA: FGGY family carbohydrate kinase [Streptosporangiaceae bacterium]
MVAEVGPGRLALREAHRFGNAPVTVAGTMHTDVLRLYEEVLEGLGAAAGAAEIASVGIDSWGVDYGLLDADGALLGNPVHYRDGRTTGAAGRLAALIDPGELYAITGVPTIPINTLCQLIAASGTAQLDAARTLLLLPDLLTYWLTGATAAEVTMPRRRNCWTSEPDAGRQASPTGSDSGPRSSLSCASLAISPVRFDRMFAPAPILPPGRR